VYIVISAALFGISAPVSKLLISDITPVALAGLLYLGAFLGLAAFRLSPLGSNEEETALKRSEIPYLAGSIVTGGIVAPILLMMGIASVTGIASSLLLNLEGVATALIAWLAFKEAVGRRTWTALALMTAAGVLLALETGGGETSAYGAALIVMAMFLWGLDNNLTRKIAGTGPQRIAMLKGLVAGTASTSLAFLLGQAPPLGPELLAALLLGSLSYGVSLVLFILALDSLGSARTGAFFALGPFIGAVASVPLLGEVPSLMILPAGALMAAGAYLLLTERHTHLHWHPRVVHEHVHGAGHDHSHPPGTVEPHSHVHVHEAVLHEHEHEHGSKADEEHHH
jgi:drug/metabolite transporter (DMT)-like permease